MKAKLVIVREDGAAVKHVAEFSDGDGHMVSVHFAGQGVCVYDRDNQTQTDYAVRDDYPVIDSRGRQLRNVADVRSALDALVYPKQSAQSESALKIVDRIGYRAWINQPSSLQRLHRFHGQNGWVIADATGGATFHFAEVPTVGAAIEVVVDVLEISRGWK